MCLFTPILEPLATGLLSEYRWLFDAAPDAMLLFSNAGTIVLANAQAERMFGYARSELADAHVDFLLPPHVRALLGENMAWYLMCVGARARNKRVQLTALRKNGLEFQAEIALGSTRHDGETMTIAALRDVTLRKPVNETACTQRQRNGVPAAVQRRLREPDLGRESRKLAI